MAILKTPKQFSPDFRVPGRKPVGDVEVDWDHPLAKGLVFCQLLDQRFLSRDIISGNTLQYGNGSKEDYKPHMGEFGLYAGTKTVSLGTAGYSIPNDLNLTGDHTILTRVKIPSEANTYLCDGRAHAGGTYYLFDGAGNLNVGGYLHYVGGDAGDMGNIALVSSGSTVRSFRDGEFKNSRPVTGDILSGFRIFSRYNDKENIEFGSSFWVFNRALSDAEAKELSKNPYQILKPVNEPLYLTSSAAPGGQTVPVGLSDETDTAFSVVPQQDLVVAVGLTLETDTSLDVSPIKDIIINVGLSEETDEALDVQRLALTDINTADEIDTALDILPIKDIIVNIGTSEETDTAFDAIPIKDILVSVGQSSETDTAFNVFAISEIGQGQEVDEALAVTPKFSGPITIQVNIASEADRALALVGQDQAGDKVISNIIFPIISNIILPIIR